MFYKIKGISPKSGKGTVSVVYRQTGSNPFETVKATGVSVAPQDFDSKTGRVRARIAEHPELNVRIAAVANDLEEAARNVKASGKLLTKASIDAEYLSIQEFKEMVEESKAMLPGFVSREEERIQKLEAKVAARKADLAKHLEIMGKHGAHETKPTVSLFTDIIAAFLVADVNHYRPATQRGYEDLRSILTQFRPALRLEDINLATFADFQKHLIKKKLKNGSIRSIIQRFKAVYRHSADEAGIATAFINKFKVVPELANDDVVFLGPEEVQALRELPLTCKAQKQVRAQFLFACEMGLRHEDLSSVNLANITGDYLAITTKKKNITVKPPITLAARAILDSEDFPFRPYHVNHYNKVLRIICKKAPGFDMLVPLTHYVANVPTTEAKPKWELVSSHVGRKTAINNWLAKGVRESIVAQWAGHKNTKMIQKHYQNKEAASVQEARKMFV